MAVLRSVVIKIGADISALQKDLNKTSKAFNKVGKNLSKVGDNLTKSITLPVAAAGAGLLKLGGDFEKSFNTIRTGTGATGEDLKGLQEDFKAVYSTVPAGMEDVSSAIADLNTRTGLAGKPLQELSTQMLNLARITGEDLSGVIKNSTRLFGDWGVEQKDTASVMDYLYKISQNTGVGFNDLNSKLVQFGAPLRQMGFDLETSAAMLGKFEKEGVNAELVLGGLRTALGKMAREGITDTKAALEEVTRQIKEAGSAGEANAIAIELFGARVGPDMAAAIREGRFEITELVSDLNSSTETINGASAETMNFSDKLALMKNQAAVALEPLGSNLIDALDSAMPAIESIIGKISEIVTWFGNLDSGSQKTILTFIGIAAAIGPVLSIAGRLTTVIGGVVRFVKLLTNANVLATAKTIIMTVAQKAAAAAQWLLNAAMTANPIGLIIVAVIALIAIVVLLIKNWDTVKEFFINLWDKVKEIFSAVWEWIKDLFLKYHPIGLIITHWDKIKEFFAGLWDKVKEIFSTVWIWLKELFFKYHPAGLIIQHWDKIKEFFSNLWAKVKEIFGAALKRIAEFATGVKDKALEAGKNIYNSIVDSIKELPKKMLQAGKNIIDSLINGIKEKIGEIKDTMSNVGSSIRNFLPFSPAKEGPLKDLNKLDFKGPISQSIKQAIPVINSQLNNLVKPNVSVSAFGNSSYSEQREITTINRTELLHKFSFDNVPAGMDENKLAQALTRVFERPEIKRVVDKVNYDNQYNKSKPLGGMA